MAKKLSAGAELLKSVLDQIAGELKPDTDLIPEYAIKGSGTIMCYDPNDKMFKAIARGTKVYIIQKNFDYKGRHLVYTLYGSLVCIDDEELFLLVDFD